MLAQTCFVQPPAADALAGDRRTQNNLDNVTDPTLDISQNTSK